MTGKMVDFEHGIVSCKDDVEFLKSEVERLEKDKKDLEFINSQLVKQIGELKMKFAEGSASKEKSPVSASYSVMEYESLRDKALEMAYILKKIDEETHMCAMCGGSDDCSYSYEQYLKNICAILFSSEGNYKKVL